MKKAMVILFSVLILLSCNNEKETARNAEEFQKQFLENNLSWDAVVAEAKKEKEVNFYYWGGSKEINLWVDSVVAPAMKALDIKLHARRVISTREVIDLIITEDAVGRDLGLGSVDVVWVNGDNFMTLSQLNKLFGSFATLLPNSKNFEWDENDPRSIMNNYDFGLSTEQKEMPWSSAQFVYYVNRAIMPKGTEPRNFNELKGFLEKNPGKFTYITPNHYLGTTFLSEVLYAFNPSGNGALDFQKDVMEYDLDELIALLEPGFNYLKSIRPLLYGKGTIYPENRDGLDILFSSGEVVMGMSFSFYDIKSKIADGIYPKETELILFPENNMIKNKSYLAIPSNVSHPAASLVLINLLSSVDMQISKRDISSQALGIDIWKLSEEERKKINNADTEIVGTTLEELNAHAVSDIDSDFIPIIKTIWDKCIFEKSDASFEEVVEYAYNEYLASNKKS